MSCLQLFKAGVLIMDEVDLILHPLKSELNFPIGGVLQPRVSLAFSVVDDIRRSLRCSWRSTLSTVSVSCRPQERPRFHAQQASRPRHAMVRNVACDERHRFLLDGLLVH
jgi:hypothetical protein